LYTSNIMLLCYFIEDSFGAVAIDAFEVAIEVHAGCGNTDKVAVDSPITKQ